MVGRLLSYYALCLAAFSAAPLHAQGGTFSNEIYIEQSGSANELTVNQSQARFATVRGFSGTNSLSVQNTAPLAPALQDGTGNIADIQMTGGAAGAPLLAELSQQGNLNSGSIEITGFNSRAGLLQIGNNNNGTVSVDGNNMSGTLIQRGDDNDIGLSVDGTTASNVTYEVIGSGITTVNGGASIVTNTGGSITIRQTLVGGS